MLAEWLAALLLGLCSWLPIFCPLPDNAGERMFQGMIWTAYGLTVYLLFLAVSL